jgi:LysM repeat protein
MQIFVIKKDSDLKRVIAAAPASTVQDLQRFNPHVDFTKLAPGTVLVIPDALRDIQFPTGDAESIGPEALASFTGFAKDALQASAKRLRAGAERAKTEEGELAAAAKSQGVNDAVGHDPALKEMIAAALKTSQEDGRAAAEGIKAFDALSKAALSELQALGKRLA